MVNVRLALSPLEKGESVAKHTIRMPTQLRTDSKKKPSGKGNKSGDANAKRSSW